MSADVPLDEKELAVEEEGGGGQAPASANPIRLNEQGLPVIKILLIGEAAVGKSSLLLRFAEDAFSDKVTGTIGVDFKLKRILVDGREIVLQIWDTAGTERFRTVMPSLYRGAHGMLLVYDVTQESSFLGLPEWKSEVDSLTHSQLRAILIGNKCDQIQDKVVTTVRAEELADKLGVAMFETSAAHNVNVTEAFISLARDVLRSVEIRARSPRGDEAERVRLAAKAPPPAAKRKCRC